jgi:NADPH:quinone reductase
LKEYAGFIPRLAEWLREGKVSIRVNRGYPLADAPQAHAAFENREVAGRLLLIP